MKNHGTPWLDRAARIRYRLLLTNVLVVAVPLIGILFARFYEREMLQSLEQDMIHQAELVRQTMLGDSQGLRMAEREGMLAAAARTTRTRIRILDAHGEVLADSHRSGPPEGTEPDPPSLMPRLGSPREAPETPGPPALQDIPSRPEVQKALTGEYGSNVRLWENGDRLFLFSALPVRHEGRVVGAVYVTRSTNVVRSALYRFRATLLTVLGASVAAAAILSLFLARTISAPLSHLTRSAQRIVLGDRSQPLRLNRRDEIGQLARAIDTMARHLEDRARATRELAANISHEFKSPLTSIRGASELLLDGAADDATVRARFLRNILSDAHRLDRLVSRLLELSRLEADPTPCERFDYQELVREAAAQTNGDAPVVVRCQQPSVGILARRVQLASVLGNLLDNAQQFAAPGSQIQVTVCVRPNRSVRTEVHNEGPAISQANLGRIWDRFFTTRQEQGGTGLGLPIVAAIISGHGGSVGVTSEEGKGTTFHFDLPRELLIDG